MRAQIVLTSAESKKLIAKAIAAMDSVKKAMEKGLIVIHPSSTTLFLIEELTGTRPEGLWASGVVIPKGLCISRERQEAFRLELLERPMEKVRDHGKFRFSWVLENGMFQTGLPLNFLLDKMGSGDVYVKGVNAIDPEGKAGVLCAGVAAGTLGKVTQAFRHKGFMILFPVGLEKLIPTPIARAAKYASRTKTDLAMGIPVGLIPVAGKVVTELEAIDILSGAEAVAIAAGGLGGAEGSVTLVIQGPEPKVKKAYQIIENIKGATLPKLSSTDCGYCPYTMCHLNKDFAGRV